MPTAPLLSIGIIFKNEERCIERCLKSLEPLRKAVPCELVMADTGATDGSRAIAERYADLVFDFAWVDDFAAARNAVMDRCRGEWYFSIDCDEWLDEDISELVGFLKKKKTPDYALMIVRNYRSAGPEQSDLFSDLNALRLLRLATGQRYVGAIHEFWVLKGQAHFLPHTILHHDGYAHTSAEAAEKKLRRNMRLLRKELEREPESLRTLNECIDSGKFEPEYLDYVRSAVALVQRQAGLWRIYGGCILRSAAEAAREQGLPELWDWIAHAEKTFPDSPFTQIDLQYTAFWAACDREDWAGAVQHGAAYQKGLQALRAGCLGKQAQDDLARSPLRFASAAEERLAQVGLANACLQSGRPERALDLISKLDAAGLSARQVQNAVVILGELHARTTLDVAPVLTALYGRLAGPHPGKPEQQAWLAAFDVIAAAAFTGEYRQEEQKNGGWWRPAYTAFAALADVCEAGRAAKLMTTADPADMHAILAKVEDWQALPIEALEHALIAGVTFPLPEKPLPLEVLDGLASRLAHGSNLARQLTLALPEDISGDSGLQSLCWAQALALAALGSFDWTLGKRDVASQFACPPKHAQTPEEQGRPEDTPEAGLALLRRFAGLERVLLPRMYAPAMLTDENASLLPPMHRWGLYCARAFDVLDNGSPQGYLAALRRGLAACPGQKEMVHFLLEHFQEDPRPEASPELLALAEKVRSILAAYGPNSPAARAICESPAYKQVAWLIEQEPLGQMPQ